MQLIPAILTLALVLFDITGRRPLMIGVSILCTLFLYLATGLGMQEATSLDQVSSSTILACFILLPAFPRISASNNAFLTGAEIGGVRMRKKTMVITTKIALDKGEQLMETSGFWNRM